MPPTENSLPQQAQLDAVAASPLRSLAWLAHWWLPAAMGAGLCVALAATTPHGRADAAGLCAIVAGALVIYSLDRLASASTGLRWALIGMAVLGGALIADLVLSGRIAALPILVLSLLGLLYGALKRMVPKNLLVAGGWAWALASLGCPEPPSALAIAAVSGLLFAGCVLCDIKDVSIDRANGVRSLCVWLGARRAAASAALIAVLSLGVCIACAGWALAASGLLLIALALRPVLLRRAPLGPLLVDASLALPGLCLVL